MGKASAGAGGDDRREGGALRTEGAHRRFQPRRDFPLRNSGTDKFYNIGKRLVPDGGGFFHTGDFLHVLDLAKLVEVDGHVEGRLRAQELAQLRKGIIQHRVSFESEFFPAARLDAFRRLRKKAFLLLDNLEKRRLLRRLLRVTGIRHQKRVRLRNQQQRVVSAKAAEIVQIDFLIDDDGVRFFFAQKIPQPGKAVGYHFFVPESRRMTTSNAAM